MKSYDVLRLQKYYDKVHNSIYSGGLSPNIKCTIIDTASDEFFSYFIFTPYGLLDT